jgi:hypothetical protein
VRNQTGLNIPPEAGSRLRAGPRSASDASGNAHTANIAKRTQVVAGTQQLSFKNEATENPSKAT